ncbi:MAG: hypothetical protein WBP22_00735 [Candidatus Saccharimonas sp.]
MQRPVFYLDLDRTLFRTENASDIFAMIEELYPESYRTQGAYARLSEHYVYPRSEQGDTTTYYHDVTEWLVDIGLNPQEVFARLLKTPIADGRFEYDGVGRLVSALRKRGEVKIFTYGEDRYQRFKANLCPSLRNVDIITTIGSKVEYLNEYGLDGDWMIDDKVLDGVKPAVRTVRVVQEREVKGTLHSLDEVLKAVLNEDISLPK